jgi:hypothetical protein
MSGVNSNVIMSGYGDENPDDERRETARDNTKSVSRRADSGGAGMVIGVRERQCYRIKARVTKRGAKGVVHGNRGRPCKRKMQEKDVRRVVELGKGKYRVCRGRKAVASRACSRFDANIGFAELFFVFNFHQREFYQINRTVGQAFLPSQFLPPHP